jgi:Tetratricopeptide repeat
VWAQAPHYSGESPLSRQSASRPGRRRGGAGAPRARTGDLRRGARPRAPHYGVELISLANVLKDQGDLAGARPLNERALAICERALGPEHPNTVVSLHNLANLLHAQGDLVGARPRARGSDQ